MSEHGMTREEAIWGIPIVTGASLIQIANHRNSGKEAPPPAAQMEGLPQLHELRVSQYA